ncbi:hypothetical protein PIB30_098501 [Stylosanthes scabra]|uniref:Uncharacterized protein n=1 Tax=Stylosanthes scabra TaxID=79078 RepID=A0ABU6SX33_9FABA|nr:hypothetical protein [Stylosanthes scabra]
MGEVPTEEALVMTEAITHTLEDLKEVETRVRSGTEDGVVVKGKVVDAKTEPFSHLLVDDKVADMHCGAEAGDVDDEKSEIATFVEGAPLRQRRREQNCSVTGVQRSGFGAEREGREGAFATMACVGARRRAIFHNGACCLYG